MKNFAHVTFFLIVSLVCTSANAVESNTSALNEVFESFRAAFKSAHLPENSNSQDDFRKLRLYCRGLSIHEDELEIVSPQFTFEQTGPLMTAESEDFRNPIILTSQRNHLVGRHADSTFPTSFFIRETYGNKLLIEIASQAPQKSESPQTSSLSEEDENEQSVFSSIIDPSLITLGYLACNPVPISE